MSEQPKHVLLSTDLSDESLDSIMPVCSLVKSMNGRITVLYVQPTNVHHAIGSPFVSPVALPTDDEFVERAKKRLEELRPRFEGCEVTMAVELGEDVPETILEYVDQHNVDVIALSTHARKGLSRLVMGSIAEAVIRHSPVPCYVIPQKHD